MTCAYILHSPSIILLKITKQFAMTYKELLNLVTFKEVEPHIVNMYPEAKDCLGWFKLHYDMLKQMTPKRHDDSNGDYF